MGIPVFAKDSPGEQVLLWGNEAIARGAIEAGVNVAASYPGTPASEILTSLARVAKDFDMYAEWSTNEKVAMEVAIGAAITGLRSMVSMKHVGLNWAADPLMSLNQSGVRGGMVIVTADDPSAHSSQNEQDNRFYAMFSELPMLEPADPQEAKNMTAEAFDLSEELELPVMIRSVTRLSHSRGNVTLGQIRPTKQKAEFVRDPHRWVMVPSWAHHRHKWLHEKQKLIQELTLALPYNELRIRGKELGIVGCGSASNYALDALKILELNDKVSYLKIGVANPAPTPLVKTLLQSVERVLVLEEVEPFVERRLKEIAYDLKASVDIRGRLTGDLPREWELNAELTVSAISKLLELEQNESFELSKRSSDLIPPRSIVMCPGCPHRATFFAIRRAIRKPIITGDIGCYTLSAFPPLEMQDTCFCMGGSIGIGIGVSKAGVENPVIATLGDSTFFHAGMPALVNAVFNKANLTIIVFDNQTVAMTGFQQSPSAGKTAMGETTHIIRIEEIARASGIDFVEVIDPFDIEKSIEVIKKAVEHNGPAVVVSRRLCALLQTKIDEREGKPKVLYAVDSEKCTGCKICLRDFGCPAIVWDEGIEKTNVEPTLCVGCGVCAEICPYQAYSEVED
ncbi:MAG: indolepyruvate ferredoxin oxidoreductase subunit alpha [Promethearchaeota archaeon]